MKREVPPDAGSSSGAPLPVARRQDVQDCDSEPRNYLMGECGHRVPQDDNGVYRSCPRPECAYATPHRLARDIDPRSVAG